LRATFAPSVSDVGAAFGGLDLEPAGGKGEQISGQRLRVREAQRRARRLRRALDFLAVGERLPALGDLQVQRVARFEVRLIEAGEGQSRPCGHEHGVHEVGGTVE